MEMAKESGFEQVGHDSFQEFTTRIEAFAALVRADEREACAKLCEDAPEPDGRDLAERIRARGGQA
jgi:hypothetical protein